MKIVNLYVVWLFVLICSCGSKTVKDPVEVKDSVSYGLDISVYQGDEVALISNNKYNLSFVYCKATEGVGYINPDFKANRKLASQNGLAFGAYHFYHCGLSSQSQANSFLTIIGDINSGELPAMVDFEESGLDGVTDKEMIQKNLLDFLSVLEQKTGIVPILYTNFDCGTNYLANKSFSRYPLWIADYTNKTAPKIPVIWKTSGWRLWQKSNHYLLNGVANDFDECKDLISLIKP